MLIIFMYVCTDIHTYVNIQLATDYFRSTFILCMDIHTYVCKCMHSCIYEHVGVYMYDCKSEKN